MRILVCISTCAWAQLARMPISSCAGPPDPAAWLGPPTPARCTPCVRVGLSSSLLPQVAWRNGRAKSLSLHALRRRIRHDRLGFRTPRLPVVPVPAAIGDPYLSWLWPSGPIQSPPWPLDPIPESRVQVINETTSSDSPCSRATASFGAVPPNDSSQWHPRRCSQLPQPESGPSEVHDDPPLRCLTIGSKEPMTRCSLEGSRPQDRFSGEDMAVIRSLLPKHTLKARTTDRNPHMGTPCRVRPCGSR